MRIRRKRIPLFSLSLLFLLQGCAALLPPVQFDEQSFISRPVRGVPVTIRYLPRDAAVVPLIEESVRTGITRVGRWGELERPITVVIYPDHPSLEKSVHKKGYGWLKAWATEEGISLQSPESWPLVRKKNLFDLMTHELTHVVYFQIVEKHAGRSDQEDPVWFLEGLASYTAGQGYRRYSKRRLLRKLQSEPDFDPLSPKREDVQNRMKLVYSSAHYLMECLVQVYGEARIRELLCRRADGDTFNQAFEAVYPISLDELRRQWVQWLEST